VEEMHRVARPGQVADRSSTKILHSKELWEIAGLDWRSQT
jgi:hypothetical protein